MMKGPPPPISAPSAEPVPAAPPAAPGEELINRKLIRPHLAQHGASSTRPVARRRPAPPELTGAESTLYQRQVRLMTPLVVTLENGETLRGTLEWYDRDSLRLRRTDGPSVVVMKHAILHTCRDEDAAKLPTSRSRRE